MIEQASELISEWQETPQTFLSDVLGVESIWRMQDELLTILPKAIKEHKSIYIGSGHSLGKDYICAAIALWFLFTRYKSKVVLTAPTERQVKKVMWGEVLSHWKRKKIDLGGKPYADPYLEINKEDWYLIGFTTKESGASKDASGGKFQGFHADSVCVIASEAQAIEDSIFDQIDAVTTGANNLRIFIGNPTRSSGQFIRGLKNKTDNYSFNFSCLDNPNYKQKKTVVPGLTSYEWVEDKRKKWGEDDPRWQGRVLGIPPTSSINTVISEDLYSKCVNRELNDTRKTGVIGVDPARFGVDNMVISVLESGYFIKDYKIPKCEATEGCSHIAMAQKEHFPSGQVVFVIDCDGLGGPFLDFLKKMIPDQLNCKFIEIHGASTNKNDVDPEYQNMRAQISFHAKEQLKNGLVSLDEDQVSKEEALAEEYFVNTRGKIQIIEKEEIRDSLGRSPDTWDARKLAIWGMQFAENIGPNDKYARGYKDSLISPGSNGYMAA